MAEKTISINMRNVMEFKDIVRDLTIKVVRKVTMFEQTRLIVLLALLVLGLSACNRTDIAITDGAFSPKSPSSTDTLKVTLEVANLGNTQIKDAVISVFFGIGRAAFALPDKELPRVTLSPGTSTPIAVLWPLPPAWGNKDVTIWAEADVTREIDESNETNNRLDLGTVRIAPPGAFICQNSDLIIARFRNETYECFDIREKSKAEIEQVLSPNTARLLLFGTYTVIDCPVSKLDAAYDHITFANTIQHEIQTNNVGASPVINFDTSFNPWNLIYIVVYSNVADLQEDCGVESASACAGGFRIRITERHLEPFSGVVGINEGNRNYYYSIRYPDNCHGLEFHEYQHIIDRNLLKPHPLWFEEMIARLFADGVHFTQLLCPEVEFYNIFKITDGERTELTEPPDLRLINSERPLNSFANLYANGDSCREAIIMQMNREAYNKEAVYLRKLFRRMRNEDINTDDQIARVVLMASDNDPTVKNFLEENGCQCQ